MNKKPELIATSGDSLRESFGKTLVSLANQYPKVIVLDADIAGGTGIHHFREKFPDRFVQCGIAEQNMMAMSGGMAAVGLIPIVTTFAVFMLRAIEQARLSIAYADMNVKIKPTIIIANTIKGKGVSYMENSPTWHGSVKMTKVDLKQALLELGASNSEIGAIISE